jgi:hypothetical protein
LERFSGTSSENRFIKYKLHELQFSKKKFQKNFQKMIIFRKTYQKPKGYLKQLGHLEQSHDELQKLQLQMPVFQRLVQSQIELR